MSVASDEKSMSTKMQALVDAAKVCGADITYTVYPDGNHNAWDATYANPALYAWFLDHKN